MLNPQHQSHYHHDHPTTEAQPFRARHDVADTCLRSRQSEAAVIELMSFAHRHSALVVEQKPATAAARKRFKT